MKNIYITCVTLLLSALILACNPESELVEYDLVKHGLTIKILTPEEPEVKVTDLGIAKDITVKKGDDYNIQIIASTASTYKKADLISEKKQEAEGSPYFSQIISENENGFVFEKKIDENNIYYDFRAVKIQGDMEYVFQTGLMGRFSREAVEKMFEAVQ